MWKKTSAKVSAEADRVKKLKSLKNVRDTISLGLLDFYEDPTNDAMDKVLLKLKEYATLRALLLTQAEDDLSVLKNKTADYMRGLGANAAIPDEVARQIGRINTFAKDIKIAEKYIKDIKRSQ